MWWHSSGEKVVNAAAVIMWYYRHQHDCCNDSTTDIWPKSARFSNVSPPFSPIQKPASEKDYVGKEKEKKWRW